MSEKLNLIYDVWDAVTLSAAGCACVVKEHGIVAECVVVVPKTKKSISV